VAGYKNYNTIQLRVTHKAPHVTDKLSFCPHDTSTPIAYILSESRHGHRRCCATFVLQATNLHQHHKCPWLTAIRIMTDLMVYHIITRVVHTLAIRTCLQLLSDILDIQNIGIENMLCPLR